MDYIAQFRVMKTFIVTVFLFLHHIAPAVVINPIPGILAWEPQISLDLDNLRVQTFQL